ncbi:MAG: response regulator [Bacteroidia bacterium]
MPRFKPNTLKKKILVLEDDSVNQELLKLYLNDEFDSVLTSTIEEAMEHMNSESFDLCIADLFLGDSDKGGIEFLKMVKANPKLSHIPVVAFTGYENPNNQSDVKFTYYIQKPIMKSDFLAVIKKLLQTD